MWGIYHSVLPLHLSVCSAWCFCPWHQGGLCHNPSSSWPQRTRSWFIIGGLRCNLQAVPSATENFKNFKARQVSGRRVNFFYESLNDGGHRSLPFNYLSLLVFIMVIMVSFFYDLISTGWVMGVANVRAFGFSRPSGPRYSCTAALYAHFLNTGLSTGRSCWAE